MGSILLSLQDREREHAAAIESKLATARAVLRCAVWADALGHDCKHEPQEIADALDALMLDTAYFSTASDAAKQYAADIETITQIPAAREKLGWLREQGAAFSTLAHAEAVLLDLQRAEHRVNAFRASYDHLLPMP